METTKKCPWYWEGDGCGGHCPLQDDENNEYTANCRRQWHHRRMMQEDCDYRTFWMNTEEYNDEHNDSVL